MRRTVQIAVAAALVVTVACGKTATTATGDPIGGGSAVATPDPCGLVTNDELQTATGHTVSKAGPQSDGRYGGKECDYEFTPSSTHENPVPFVVVGVKAPGANVGAKEDFDTGFTVTQDLAKSTNHALAPARVSGIGDEAYTVHALGDAEIWVLKGSYIVIVDTNAGEFARAKEIAADVLLHLPRG